MGRELVTGNDDQISRVMRSKDAARASYDRLSKWYDTIAGSSEWKYVQRGLEQLKVAEGETVLEIGFGTGRAITALARSVGESGHVFGIDLSPGMFAIASQRVDAAGFSDRVELTCSDALKLPYDDNKMDAVFMSFALELFDTPEIPLVLGECDRVLRDMGRIVVVAMLKKSGANLAVRLYEWAHDAIPNYADCRPIYVKEVLEEAGFQVTENREMSMWGLPLAIVTGENV
jgi:demethylmenaquinone methyltransferase/2-methoxy-6-polyprenyl-1,4-benzoquinol methylase